MTRTSLPKRASYGSTDAGVNIASNTLACFSARLGLLPQFGPEYGRARDFRRKFVQVLREVQIVYPTARLDVTDTGLVLHNSRPPISKPVFRLSKGMVIDATPIPTDPVD